MRKALITAGGTRESIDDVRLASHIAITSPHDPHRANDLCTVDHFTIDNAARGLFGWEFAKAFLAHGWNVTLVASLELARVLPDSLPHLQVVTFRSFQDLHDALVMQLPRFSPDLVMMSAAVSDYSPIAVEGKLSSDLDELTIRFRKNPKLLELLRALTGETATLVGFKLLSGVSEEGLLRVAAAQIERCGLDFCIANDLQKIDPVTRFHPISLVAKSGSVDFVSGFEPEVVAAVLPRLLERVVSKSLGPKA